MWTLSYDFRRNGLAGSKNGLKKDRKPFLHTTVKMNIMQKEIMANMLYINLMMFVNNLAPEERSGFANKIKIALDNYSRPATPPPIVAPQPVRFAKGPPSEPVWKTALPTIPEIKFEGPIWDSATMVPPSDDMRFNAGSPAFVPRG